MPPSKPPKRRQAAYWIGLAILLSISKAFGATPAKMPSEGHRGTSFVVVIDAGHGGKDSGALGPRGTQEKTVVLAIAKRLNDYLHHEAGIHPVMVRQNDLYVSLSERAKLARRVHADLFISLHADAYEGPAARGSSVYTLSQHGASSEAARTLADRENAGEVGGVDLRTEDAVLAGVLVDLSKNASLEASEVAATRMLKALRQHLMVHHEAVQKAGFKVLKSLDVPSMLIETGFISNPDEESALMDPQQQDKIARALLRGIKAYAHP